MMKNLYLSFLIEIMKLRNSQQYVDTSKRASFFQTVQAWPLLEELNYEGWLKNFKTGHEQDIACIILDFFTYYPVKMINQMFKTAVSGAGYFFLKEYPDWVHSDFFDRCIYSFIPGESPNPTDSGNLFTRKLRDNLGVPESRIVSYDDIVKTVSNIKQPTPIIFVDDFVGSGAQIYKAWKENLLSNGKTLREFCLAGSHCPVFCPLVVNTMGYNVLKNDCKGLHLSTVHILAEEYNLFDPKCICWKNDVDLFKKGTQLILRKSKELGIPSTNGQSVNDEKGFGQQGLALAFEHGAPDAVPAIFYWKAQNWTPLIRKKYQV